MNGRTIADEPPVGIIRPYEAKDREAVREICRRTAYRNKGSDAVFEDGELFADYWCNYYTDYEPESCLVAEENGEVVGYLFGCVDAKRLIHVMGRRVVPKVVFLMLFRYLTFRYRKKTTRRTVRWFLLHSWREMPAVSVEDYPPHYHCNILRKGYGKHYYSRLALVFLDRLIGMGMTHLHGNATEPKAAGGISGMHMKSHTFDEVVVYYAEVPSSFNRFVLGDTTPMMNRVWGMKLDLFRDWIAMAAVKFRI